MLGTPTPILRSFDEASARAFYVDFLGFQVEFEHRFEEGLPLYMGLRRGDCALHLSEHYGDSTPGSAVRIPVDDVTAYMAALRRSGFGHSSPGKPQLTEWGTIEITICDPASNRLIFFTNVDGQALNGPE